MKRRHLMVALAAGLAAVGSAALAAWAQPVPMHLSTPAPYTTTVGAHARYSKARINLGVPQLALTTALIRAGGGSPFDAPKLVGNLTGNGPLTQTELASLTRRFGADNVTSFEKTFNYVVSDAIAQSSTMGVALPPTPVPDPNDAKALCSALYAAGITPRGSFDVEYMLDSLFSHVIHVAVMNDIDADPGLGPQADANYHAVLAQLMLDLK